MFENSQEFSARPDSDQYTHVCRLCWPKGKGEGSQASASGNLEENPASPGDSTTDFHASRGG